MVRSSRSRSGLVRVGNTGEAGRGRTVRARDRRVHVGEGGYDDTQREIEALLGEDQ